MTVTAAEVAAVVELLLVLAGGVLLWRHVLSPAARRSRMPSPLPAWDMPVADFGIFILYVLFGSVVLAIAAAKGAPVLNLRGDAATVFAGAASQLGMLAGVAAFHFRSARSSMLPPVKAGPGALVSGIATFLVALPVLIVTAKAWEILLRLSNLPVDRQDLIGMFANADSPWMLAIMIALAVVIAPVTEELVFRAGLYRFVRTRIPRWIALAVPALFFAALHVDWHTLRGLSSLAPLAMLAVVFSLAYERTGRIGTAIVAHALFNLNTVLLILSGVEV